MTVLGRRPIRLLVADDVQVLVEAFVEALEHYEDIEVVGTAFNGEDAIAKATQTLPDIILMDVRMPVMDGIMATKEIVAIGLGARVLMMTAYDDDSLVNEAMDAGAFGYLVKGTLVADTVVAIRAAFARSGQAADDPSAAA